MKKAIAYYRYSSHKQTETSIEGQQAAAQKWAAENGYELVQEYADRAQSGTTADRAEFQRMLREVATLRPETLIVWKVDRLGRNREAVALTKYKLKKVGCTVTYLAEAIPEGPEGVILESVLEGMAEFFSLQLAQNVRRGMAVNASKGLWHGGHVPFGYMVGEDKKLHPDPQTAPVVRRIYEQYAEGQTTAEIIRQLNAEGIRATSGKPLTRNSLRTVLHSRRYIGESESMGYKVEIEPLVTPELWETVQRMQERNRNRPKDHTHRATYMLTGKLFCGICGHPMTGLSGKARNGTVHYYYRCSERQNQKDNCTMKNVRRDEIEEKVIQATKRLLFDDAVLTHIAACTWDYYRQTTDAGLLDTLRAQLKETQASISNLVAVLATGVTSTHVVSALSDLEAREKELLDGIKLEEARAAAAPSEEFILYALKKLRETDFSDPAAVQRLITTFVNSVYVWPDHSITIGYNYRDGEETIDLPTAAEAAGVPADGLSSARYGVPEHHQTNRLVFLSAVVLVTLEKETAL